MKKYLFILPLLLLTFSVKAQNNIETFGKNRVQYRTFEWKFIDYKRFRIYYYDRGGKDLARFVAEQADKDVFDIERKMSGNFPNKVNIILYNSYDEYIQSNVGLETELEITNQVTGNVKIAGDKLVVYFSGSHQDLKDQIRRGIAQVIIERAMFGDDIKSFAKNTISQTIPQWSIDGYMDYMVYGWDPLAENEWKQFLNTDKKIFFNDFTRTTPHIAGRAFWKYIQEKYGTQKVNNLFFTTLQKNSLNKALKSVLDINMVQIYDSLMLYYKNRYNFEKGLADNPNNEEPLFIIKPANVETNITEVKVSPRGKDIAYVEWENGKYKVTLETTESQRGTNENVKATIFRGGVRDYTAEQDPQYPKLAWSNTGFKLAILYSKNGKNFIKLYDAIKGSFKTFPIRSNKFDRIQGFTFMEDDEMIIISGLKNGQSDLFEYRLKNGSLNQLTKDAYDDLSPEFISGGARKGISFISNRPLPFLNVQPLPNEMPLGPLNAYFYNATTKSDSLMQLTKKDKDYISEIIPYGPDHFSYLSNESGINNRYLVLFSRDENNMDTAFSVPITNYSSSIISQQYNPASGKVAEVIKDGSSYKIYFRKANPYNDEGKVPVMTPLKIQSVNVGGDLPIDQNNPINTKLNIQAGDDFKSDFYEEYTAKGQLNDTSDTISSFNYATINETPDGKRLLFVDSTFLKLSSTDYRKSFMATSFTARMDNSVVFNRYQNYNGNFGAYRNPDLGAMILFSFKDRMEDYRIMGGFRIGGDLGLTYLLKFQNLRKRLDWGATGFVQTINDKVWVTDGQVLYEVPTRMRMTILQADFSYPLDRVRSLKAYAGFRLDNTVYKASNIAGLILKDLNEYYSMTRVEYVYDDTRYPAHNIWNGVRYKAFAEYLYRFYSNNENFISENGKANNKTGGFYNIGFDARYYKPIYKNFIFAVRGVGAHSGGSHQIMYSLGGVDNAINPQYNYLLKPTLKNTYAFQALATNLRGYMQNARNGNTYLLVNAELRLPLITTFINMPINNNFLKNLQLVAFVDAGSAWEGLLPDNQLQRTNTFFYPDQYNPSVRVTVPYPNANGLALGYGAGLRFFAYSYFIKVDYARNIENRERLHISFGLDF